MADVKTFLDAAEKKMNEAVAYLDETLSRVRAGKANPKILEPVKVEYYGSMMPIANVANVAVPDARSITITPWEKPMIKVIEKAILDSNIGITPENNGEIIRLNFPPLTEDRRKQLVLKKAVKDGMPEDSQKDGEEKVQKLHDKFLKKIDEVFAAKEKEILTV